MKFHIITSSYPATPQDPSGTAGLFVREFALELVALGHTVIVQPVARKPHYQPDPGIIVAPTPWRGGDRELASMSSLSPVNWFLFLLLFINGICTTRKINKQHSVDRMLCMWAVPSGVFGLAGKLLTQIPYDVWALGSDIWKIRKIPVFGRLLLRQVITGADRVYADGRQLCADVSHLTGVTCNFLATSRTLPGPSQKITFRDGQKVTQLLFVGRYHPNKGPDLLLEAIALLPEDIKESLHLHMFGLGPMAADLEKIIKSRQLERYVDLHGPIKAQDLADYLHSVSYLIIPSRIESIPVIFSDALQIDTPVVTMPAGDLAALVRESGCGIVAKEISAHALARALEEALAHDKTAFTRGVRQAYEQFKLRNTVVSWLNHDEGGRRTTEEN